MGSIILFCLFFLFINWNTFIKRKFPISLFAYPEIYKKHRINVSSFLWFTIFNISWFSSNLYCDQMRNVFKVSLWNHLLKYFPVFQSIATNSVISVQNVPSLAYRSFLKLFPEFSEVIPVASASFLAFWYNEMIHSHFIHLLFWI